MLNAGGGSVVDLIGQMVSLGVFDHVHAFGSKLGIEGLIRQLATDFGSDGVRVNGLSPGLIDVGRDPTDEWARVERDVIDATPLGRLGRVDEVADACCYLASDRVSFVTGQVLHVNGGPYPTPTLVSR